MDNYSHSAEDGLTGIELLDRHLRGRTGPTGVHGIFGSTGTGLTTMACMLAAERARRAAKDSVTGETRKRVALVTNQTRRAVLRGCLAAYLSNVPFTDLTNSWPQSPAERLDAASQRRLETAAIIINNHVLFIDTNGFSNTIWDPDPAAQISAVLDGNLTENESLSSVVIDDMGAMTRHRLGFRASHRKYAWMMHQFLRSCRRIADSHCCPVWIAHHLKGAVGKNSPNALLTHRDAEGCNTLGNKLDACFVVGNHARSGMFQIVCTKCRVDKDRTDEVADGKGAAVARICLGGAKIEEVSDQDRQKFYEKPRLTSPVSIDYETFEFIQCFSDDDASDAAPRRVVRD